MKRTTMRKYLSIPAYLEYLKLKENGKDSSFDELDGFFIKYGLPSLREIKEQNLRVYINNDVAVDIYNIEEIKKDHVLITEKIG